MHIKSKGSQLRIKHLNHKEKVTQKKRRGNIKKD